MQEHPVPQNITAYEFHLIGSMTIKQFLILLGGGAIGLFFYSTNLPGLIKWPLAVIGVISGIAMAFVPYEERTLDQWFINFIKAIYRPTKFYWRRTPHVPEFFTYSSKVNSQLLYQPDTSPLKRDQVNQYLSSLNAPEKQEAADALDLFQSKTDVLSLFSQVDAASNVLPSEDTVARPSLTPRARPLGRTQVIFAPSTNVSQASMPAPTSASPAPAALSDQPVGAILSEEREEEKQAQQQAASHEARVAAMNVISVEPSAVADREIPVQEVVEHQAAQESHYAAPQAVEHEVSGVLPAIFNRELPFPSLPTQANLLIGMVHDRSHAIVANAIVEILDNSGNTVRAMKTNSLGQFYISSPLKAGIYTLETEKDGLSFPVYQFEAKDQVLDPIDIQANG